MLICVLATDMHAACPAHGRIQEQKSCRTSSSVDRARRHEFYQSSDLSHNFLTNLQQESLKEAQELQKEPKFQDIVAELQNNPSQSQNTAVNSVRETQGSSNDVKLNGPGLCIFVSFSMGEKALLNIAHEAKRFGATLVLKGFKEGSYRKTAQALQEIIIKTGEGFIIDPELYTLFNITAVPTFVLAKTFQLPSGERIQTPIKWAPIKWAPIHDKVQGHGSAQYALEVFAKEGDLKDEAQALLKSGSVKEGGATK